MNMKRKQAVVIKAPLLDGDSMPNMATTITHTQIRSVHRWKTTLKGFEKIFRYV